MTPPNWNDVPVPQLVEQLGLGPVSEINLCTSVLAELLQEQGWQGQLRECVYPPQRASQPWVRQFYLFHNDQYCNAAGVQFDPVMSQSSGCQVNDFVAPPFTANNAPSETVGWLRSCVENWVLHHHCPEPANHRPRPRL